MKLDPYRDDLLTVIEAVPDTTIEELQRRLVEDHGLRASTGTIWTFLDRCGLTFKTKSAHAAEQDRPDVLKKREDWFDGNSTSIRTSSSSSTKHLRPPTWLACTGEHRGTNGSAPGSHTAI